jgi:hypothetical protein
VRAMFADDQRLRWRQVKHLAGDVAAANGSPHPAQVCG